MRSLRSRPHCRSWQPTQATLSPDAPADWLKDGIYPLLAMSWRDYEDAQLGAVLQLFSHLFKKKTGHPPSEWH